MQTALARRAEQNIGFGHFLCFWYDDIYGIISCLLTDVTQKSKL